MADSEAFFQWQRGLRELTATLCGAFLLVYGGIEIRDPTLLALVLGAGLTALGLPGTWWLDARKRASVE